jgi:hypothetical protein
VLGIYSTQGCVLGGVLQEGLVLRDGGGEHWNAFQALSSFLRSILLSLGASVCP